MAYCRNCGAEINEKAVVCPSCGVPQQVTTEGSSIGYGILSFCIPIVGLILFLLWYDIKPKIAKTSSFCAIIGFFMWRIILA